MQAKLQLIAQAQTIITDDTNGITTSTGQGSYSYGMRVQLSCSESMKHTQNWVHIVQGCAGNTFTTAIDTTASAAGNHSCICGVTCHTTGHSCQLNESSSNSQSLVREGSADHLTGCSQVDPYHNQ